MFKLIKSIIKKVFSFTGILIVGCIFLGTLYYTNTTVERNYYLDRVEITNVHKQLGIYSNKYRITFNHKNALHTFTGDSRLAQKLNKNSSFNVILKETIWSEDSTVYTIDKVLN